MVERLLSLLINRLIERFLMDDYKAHQMSTYALTLFRYKTQVHNKDISVGTVRQFIYNNTFLLLVKKRHVKDFTFQVIPLS